MTGIQPKASFQQENMIGACLLPTSHISLTEEQKLLLDEVNDFNLEARYPQFKNEFYKKCTKPFTEHYFKQIEDVATWLKSQIKSHP